MNLAQDKPSGKRATGNRHKAGLAALGAVALLMTGAGATAQEAEKQKTFQRDYIVAAIYNYGARSIELTAHTGCVSSSFRKLGNNIRFEVDEDRALITGTGYFTYKSPKSRAAKTDCQGAAKLTIELPDVDARRYAVVINGKYRGVLDFTQSAKPPRLTTGATKLRARGKTGILARMQLSNAYASVNLDNWTSRSAASVMDLFRPITKGHPESLEGRPEMDISLRGGPKSVTVKITSYGYLDDAVAGGKYLGVVTKTADGWYLDSLWQQNLCARGKKAGQWSKGPCS